MLTVWSVCNGDKYTDADVWTLKQMVSEGLSAPHQFRCLSDRQIEGIDCIVPWEQWPGWWSKLLLFRYASGPCLYFDLDTVIVGPLDGLVSRRLAMPKNWGQSGHGGCQSSVMAWGVPIGIADHFEPERLQTPVNGNCGAYRLDDGHELWGDQEFITAHYGDPGGPVIEELKGIYSYKYHCRGKPVPSDAVVVCFHGEPKPAQVDEPWVRAARFM